MYAVLVAVIVDFLPQLLCVLWFYSHVSRVQVYSVQVKERDTCNTGFKGCFDLNNTG
jgi:hypothetical protein